ncbi:MAG: histidine-type phosphatase, partial [Acidobacteriota bacterium]
MRTIAAVSVAAFISGFTSDAARLKLEYVVIVTRHGVRAPTWETERLNRYSSEPWPVWGVPPGHLTTRGRMLMGLMGSYYGAWLSSEGLLPRTGCEGAARIYIWADTDQRTIETGRALAGTLVPGCTIPVHAQAGGGDDPLFDPIAAGLVEPDLAIAAQAVRDRLGPEPQRVLESHRRNFETLQDILTGGAPAPKKVFEWPADISVTVQDKAVALNGPLSVASTLTENFLLEYTNGFQGRDLGWGRLNADNLVRVLELHGTYADLMRRTPYLARARSSNLLAHVLRSLRQAETGHAVSGALGRAGDAVLILSGHDTNL